MTTAQAASSAMLSVALVPRKAVVPQRVAHREVEAQEEVLHAVAHQEAAILRENRTEAAVAPVVMTIMITTHRAAVVEAVGDNGYV